MVINENGDGNDSEWVVLIGIMKVCGWAHLVYDNGRW